jgi:hypothetical protein
MVVIAAYLAGHHHSEGVPTTRSELLDELLAHEQRYWKATSQAGGLAYDGALRRRVVALATLAGADSEDEASELLRIVPDLSDEQSRQRRHLARWMHELYPAGPRWWNPLEPDLLGEHLVATTYADHPEVLAAVLDRDTPHAIIQPLDLYARAAADRPELAAKLVPILSEPSQLPLRARSRSGRQREGPRPAARRHDARRRAGSCDQDRAARPGCSADRP